MAQIRIHPRYAAARRQAASESKLEAEIAYFERRAWAHSDPAVHWHREVRTLYLALARRARTRLVEMRSRQDEPELAHA